MIWTSIAKVCDGKIPIRSNEDIRRFEIPVNNSLSVEEIEPSDDISKIKSGSGSNEWAVLSNYAMKTATRYKLEHEVKVQGVLECPYNTIHPGTPR